jgi:hypothetical protein
VLRHHAAAIRFYLAKSNGRHPCPLEPKAKAADSAEKIKYPHRYTLL